MSGQFHMTSVDTHDLQAYMAINPPAKEYPFKSNTALHTAKVSYSSTSERERCSRVPDISQRPKMEVVERLVVCLVHLIRQLVLPQGVNVLRKGGELLAEVFSLLGGNLSGLQPAMLVSAILREGERDMLTAGNEVTFRLSS